MEDSSQISKSRSPVGLSARGFPMFTGCLSLCMLIPKRKRGHVVGWKTWECAYHCYTPSSRTLI